MANWTTKLASAMAEAKDPGPVLKVTVGPNLRGYEDDDEVAARTAAASMDREFNAGYGGSEGDFFTAWTETRVYFPVVYDGAEWVGSAPRNPCDEATKHIGGE